MNIFRCLHCNKEFETQYSGIETCSKKCALEYIKKLFPKTPKRYKVCVICNKIFEDKDYSIKKTCCKEHAKTLKEQTTINRYGVFNVMQNEEIKIKFKKPRSIETCEKMSNAWKEKSEEEINNINQKRIVTNLIRRGVTNPFKDPFIQKRIKNTHLKNIGVEYPTQSYKVIKKRKDNFLKKYGVDNPAKLIEVKEKKKKRSLELYGVINPSQKHIQKEVLTFFEDKENLRKLYEDDKLSSVYIANKFGVSSSYVLLKLKEYNIPTREYGNSGYETELRDYITSLGFQPEKRRKILLSGKEIDIYLPAKQIGIEFNGVYWHQEGVLKKYGKNGKRYHLDKTEEAESLGIRLIHIYEDDWIYKKDIVKNKLLQILHLEKLVYYARKCNLKEISFKEASNFLNTYHLQGSCFSSVNLGLFYNEKLIAVMTFGKFRKALGQNIIEDEYELLRYCSLGRVVGGASKLFYYFLKKYKPKKIISYADRHWTSTITCNMYDKLGFRKVSNGRPNYWYVINDKRIHRFHFRKSELHKKLKIFDSNLSEYENMLNNGYDRIWGCGSIKYEYISCF